MMDFVQMVKQMKPNLRDTSVQSYAVSLKSIAPPEATDLEFLKDTDDVMSRLEKYKPNTRKNYLNAAIVVLKGSEDDTFEKAVEFYEEKRDKFQDDYQDQVNAHKKTASQEANWVAWPDYEAMVKKMGSEVKFRGTLDSKEEQKFQDYLVVLLHQHYPVRNDFANLQVRTRKQWREMTEAEKTSHNYFVHGTNDTYSFILNHYKTSGKYGQKTMEVTDDDVKQALRRWMRHNDSEHFLRNRKGAPLNSNGITKSLARIGQKELGRKLGSSLLRHSYLSHKYAADIAKNKEKQKDAEVMMHSLQTQSEYVKTED
jgi:hypothetical protein